MLALKTVIVTITFGYSQKKTLKMPVLIPILTLSIYLHFPPHGSYNPDKEIKVAG